MHLDAQNVPILGTAANDIDNAEDRAKFSQMLTNNGISQPEWSAVTSMEDIDNFIERVGFPVLVRPSYVLSGARSLKSKSTRLCFRCSRQFTY